MKVKLLCNTKCPERKREGDAGYDFYLNTGIYLASKETTVINTGVCVEIPKGYAGLLALRSSLCKEGLVLQNPLIDSNYRGEIHAIIYNATNIPKYYKEGERLYSLYVFPVLDEKLEIVEELSESNRGTSWNGSSGK